MYTTPSPGYVYFMQKISYESDKQNRFDSILLQGDMCFSNNSKIQIVIVFRELGQSGWLKNYITAMTKILQPANFELDRVTGSTRNNICSMRY